MKFNLKIILIIILLISISFVSATPLDSLNEFYQASVDGDVDAYIAIQDPLFLAQQEMDTTAYFQSSFDEVKTLNYKIIKPEVFEEENSTLVFYELKGDAQIEGEKISIDNDMVAFLWKYDDWKVRWTITRKLYEEKIALGFVMDAAIESTINEAQGISLKQELINEGFDVLSLNDDSNSMSSFSFPWFWVIISLLILFIIIFKKRLKIILFKHRPKYLSKDNIEKAKEFSKNSFEKAKQYSKKTYKLAKPHIEKGVVNIKKTSIKLYNNAKPHIEKGVVDIKKTSIKLYNDAKPKVKKAFDTASKETKNFIKK